MLVLIVGLILFFGIHTVRIVAPEQRLSWIERIGEGPWKSIYSLISFAGLALIIWGYALARDEADLLYIGPDWARGIALIVNPIALVLVIASNFPAGYLKRLTRHPMLVGTIAFAIMHLLLNGDSASVFLFGTLLVWAIADLISSIRRPSSPPSAVKVWPDIVSIILGVLLTYALVVGLHGWLFGAYIA